MIGFGTVTGSSLIGVAIACSGNILISLALTVQKLAHRRQNEELLAFRFSSSDSSSSSSALPPESATPRNAAATKDTNHTGSNDAADGSANTVVPVLLVPATPVPGARSSDHDANSTAPALVGSVDMNRQMSLDAVPEDDKVDGMTGRLSHAEQAENGTSTSASATGRRSRNKGPKHTTNTRIQPVSANTQTSHGHGPGKQDGKSGRASERTDNTGEERSGNADGDGKGDGQKAEVEEGMYLKSKLWWFGLALISIGEGGNFLSYGFAPASVVAPLGTVALIANCIFAPLILKETFHAKELIGMALAILGAVTVVWSSRGSNPRLDPDSLLLAIKQLPFLIYTLINAVLISLLVLLSRSPRWESRFIGIDVGICALYGGYTVLSTKALSSLLSTMFFDAFEYWITWVLVLVLVVTSILQVKYLNRALMKFQSKEVIPTQFVFFSLAAIIGSAVLYQEFRDVSFSVAVNFAFGIATTFLGVYLLTTFSNSNSDDDEEPDPDSESLDPRSSRGLPAAPQRATSSASLNLLLPSTSRLSERTPLLIPVPGSQGRYPAAAALPPATVGSLTGRLLKRTSTGDFAPTLGLSSQAGFLLMATTPPSAVQAGAIRRDRSGSRTWISPPNLDEERGLVQTLQEEPSVRGSQRGNGGGGRRYGEERRESDRTPGEDT